MSFKHALDLGPVTVIGEAPVLLEPMVVHLVDKLVTVYNRISAKETLEVEGRIGMIMRGKSSSGERLRLPVITETVLKPPTDAMHFEFSSDVGSTTFTKMRKYLTELSKNNITSDKHPLFKIYSVTEKHLIDEFYQNGNERVRVTVNANAPEEVLEVMSKNRLSLLDVYSGSFSDDPNDDRPFDMRFSLNEEKQIRSGFTRSVNSMTGKREKHRWTFDSKGFVIDMTEAKSRDKSGDRTSFEVEVELKTALLVEQLQRKVSGKSHALYELVTDFIYAVRDLAWNFSTQEVSQNSIIHNLDNTQHSDESVRKYQKLVGHIQPLLGDYLYRIATELKPRQP